ncbi:hydrogenase maturation protein [Lysinibacillus xylanilyticus]|uniref:hydrogenase maturation protein n=1 Tax=Lysinibacillus xylanilyticus TaxID=582475 RepID=UPI002B2418C4|nr:hydrogenase maturation protein [Lysinibacillus xylanilyticus]MEB2282183.1 hydrogenase maturation protein [Lysinibacillus xylanilyticus]
MKILFITSAHNSMSQRFYVELTDRKYEVDIHITSTIDAMIQAIEVSKPDLIICPFLKTAIPEEIWKRYVCIIVHPGIKGDRGPSSIDWAIMGQEKEWGVTLLQAEQEMDAGDIWSTNNYSMREVSKSTLYRHEATHAAVKGLLDLLEKFKAYQKEEYFPEPLDYNNSNVKGILLPTMKQSDRSIHWLSDNSETIARKIRAADSNPGVLDTIFGEEYYLFGCHVDDRIVGNSGEILGYRDDAVCVGTIDGSVWISHVKKKGGIKLPASLALSHLLRNVPELPINPFDDIEGRTYREIYYKEKNQVGYLHFDFYNGAMHTSHCKKLQQAIKEAKTKNSKVLVLMGGHDFWSNGIHLNTIEYAENQGDESWENINAIDDMILEILNTPDKIVMTAMQGNAGAGGVILGLTGDFIFAREGVVLNPHYKKMGNLYGSEYWTYLLPKRLGKELAFEITETCPALSTLKAKEIGLIDDYFKGNVQEFDRKIQKVAEYWASSSLYDEIIANKQAERERDEKEKPLAEYRHEELEQMKINFYGEDKSYHIARKKFVYKIACDQPSVLLNDKITI